MVIIHGIPSQRFNDWLEFKINFFASDDKLGGSGRHREMQDRMSARSAGSRIPDPADEGIPARLFNHPGSLRPDDHLHDRAAAVQDG